MNPEVVQSGLPSSSVSILQLFWSANFIVQAVMVGLLIASVWVWAIAIDKTLLYTRTRQAMDRFEKTFWSGQSLEELYRTLSARPSHSMAALFVAAMREWKRSFETQARSFAGLQMRIEKVMEVTIAREVERLERRLLVLATVGSAGPFIGLFGTVWGIMNSFQSIAGSKSTSLDCMKSFEPTATLPNPKGRYASRRWANRVSGACWESRRSWIGYVSKPCSIAWSRSSSRCLMTPTSDTGEGDRQRTLCAKSGRRLKRAGNGLWMQT